MTNISVRLETQEGESLPQAVIVTVGNETRHYVSTLESSGRALQAARDADRLASERMSDLFAALHTYAVCDEVSVEESLASVGLPNDLISQIQRRYRKLNTIGQQP